MYHAEATYFLINPLFPQHITDTWLILLGGLELFGKEQNRSQNWIYRNNVGSLTEGFIRSGMQSETIIWFAGLL